MMVSHFLLPAITSPTRVTDFSKTLIDNFYLNCLSHDFKSFILYDDTSDHFPILLPIDLIRTTKCINKPVMARLYNPVTKTKFVDEIGSFDWSNLIYMCSTCKHGYVIQEFHADFFPMYL